MERTEAKRPGIFTLVAGAWRSAAGAFLALLPVFAVVAAALFALDHYAFPLLEQKLAVIRPASGSVFVLLVVQGAWLFGLEKLALGLVAAPAALVTMRRILADDGPHLAPEPLLRFWLWAAAALVLALGSLYLAGLATTPDVQLISLVLKLFAIVIPFLLLPVFPAVAVGEPAAGLSARIDKALERWDGNVWRFTLVLLLTAGPGVLLLRLPAAVVQRLPGAAADAAQTFAAGLAGGLVQSLLTVLLVVIAAAALSWCHTFTRLPKPVRQPLGI